MHQITTIATAVSTEPERKLSIWRALLGILIVAGVACGSFSGWQFWHGLQAVAAHEPWFAAYVDVTATPRFAFESLGATATRNVVLSFIVSSPDDACTPSWGGAYTLEEANSQLDLDRRIARLRQQKGHIVASFGGLLNDELAVKCTDTEKLKQAYTQVIERYDIDTIDLDLESNGLNDTEAGQRRAKVIAQIQAERRAHNKSLAIWLTLPVSPRGLSEAGTAAVAEMLKQKVDLAGINVMTMDYGQSRPDGQSMVDASKDALTQTHRQLTVLYQQAGTRLNSSTLWNKIGLTPMIGQNDVPAEVFTIDDAKLLNQFALGKKVGRMSMWSANRDIPCGENYVNLKVVSDSCSGVETEKSAFSVALSQGLNGDIKLSAANVTNKNEMVEADLKDNPATSPYQIWQESGAYLQGTKIVWHHNVYEAKWWTQGDLPDNPVLQEYQTPWKLIGPVLPDDKPIPQPTLAEGTYPNWDGTVNYENDQRVLFNGVPYRAKWWNNGESPAAASSNADNSPWTPLTQAQISDLLKNKE